MLYLLGDSFDTGHPILGIAQQFKIKDFFDFTRLVEGIDTTNYLVIEDLQEILKQDKDLPKNIAEIYEEIIQKNVPLFDVYKAVHLGLIEDIYLNKRFKLVDELFKRTFPDIDKNAKAMISKLENKIDLSEISNLENTILTIFDIVEHSEDFDNFCDMIREMNGWHYNAPHPHKVLRKREEILAQINKRNAPDTNPDSMWSTVALATGYTPTTMGDLTLKQFFELYGRIGKFKEFDVSIIGAVFGGKISYYDEILNHKRDTSMGVELTKAEIAKLDKGESSKENV